MTSGGKLNERSGSSITEGIGQGRITNNLGTFVNQLSGAFTVPDTKSIEMLYQLLDTDGLYLGASSSLNVVAAAELAVKLGKGKLPLRIYAIDGLSFSDAEVRRVKSCNDFVRWGIQIPKPIVLETMAGGQRIAGCYTVPSKEIRSVGLSVLVKI